MIQSIKFKPTFLIFINILFLVCSQPIVSAQTYTASLSGAAESPPNASAGTGTVTVTISGDIMRIQCTFSGLTGTTTAAHIHAATATPGSGTAGVATRTPSFATFPLGVSSGSFDETFDMTSTSSLRSGYITLNGGTAASAFAALKSAFAAGTAYFNIHSSTYPGGEIRGFLTVPLPVELISFTAVSVSDIDKKEIEGGVLLRWKTATESDNSHFDIERSENGVLFQHIATVKAKGVGADYSFLDSKSSNQNYYRLKFVDIDGKFEYSNVISISQKKFSKVQIFPTITSGLINISEVKELEVFNSSGQILLYYHQISDKIDLSTLPNDLYFIRGRSVDGLPFLQKIMKY